MNDNIGSKYQNNTGKMFRLIKYKNSDTAVLKNLETGMEMIIPKNSLLSNYVKLDPDAVLNIMITHYNSNGFDGNDVYAVVYRTNTIISGKVEPDLILRQDIYSYVKNPLAVDGKIYVGDCLTQYTLPDGDMKLMDLFDFSDVVKNDSFNLYSDDTLDDIFEIIGKKVKPYDEELKKLYDSRNSEMIVGYKPTLMELCEDNHFIEAYRSLFNITAIDWPIVLGKQSYNSDGDIILNSKQKKALEDLLRKHITDISVIEYGYDVDISKIVSYSHIMVSDSTEKIYLIAYTVVDDYPVDDDIAKAMGVN